MPKDKFHIFIFVNSYISMSVHISDSAGDLEPGDFSKLVSWPVWPIDS